MPYTYKISPSGDHVDIIGTGEISTAECLKLIKMIISDPNQNAESTALIDLRDATYFTRDRAEVVKIAKALEANHTVLKNNIAIVAKKATLFHAELLARHVREATEVSIKVFVDYAAAKAFCAGKPTRQKHHPASAAEGVSLAIG